MFRDAYWSAGEKRTTHAGNFVVFRNKTTNEKRKVKLFQWFHECSIPIISFSGIL